MAPKRSTPTPAAANPSSSTSYKSTSSASTSQSHTSSTMKSSTSTVIPSPGARLSSPATSKSVSSKSSTAKNKDFIDIIQDMIQRYNDEAPQRVKIIDSFMTFLILLGAIQFLYCVVAGNYPFNAFLSGFSATVGQFVLTVSLRMQTNPANKKGNFESISDERAFADFVVGSLILHLFCVNFIN